MHMHVYCICIFILSFLLAAHFSPYFSSHFLIFFLFFSLSLLFAFYRIIHLSILQQDLSLHFVDFFIEPCDSHNIPPRSDIRNADVFNFPESIFVCNINARAIVAIYLFGIFIQKSNKIPARKKLELRAQKLSTQWRHEKEKYKTKFENENGKKAMWHKRHQRKRKGKRSRSKMKRIDEDEDEDENSQNGWFHFFGKLGVTNCSMFEK